MSERLTPETDSLHKKRMSRDVMSQYFEMVSLARTLERERDEWRKKAVDLHARSTEASRISVDLINERDDTRDFLREIFNLTQIGEPHPADLPMRALQAIAEMIDEHLKEARK